MPTTAGFVDLGILLIIGSSIFIGVLRGATREVLGIMGWIGAFCTVFYGLPLVRPIGRYYLHNPMVADVCVGSILFILSLTVFILISRTLSTGVKGSLLGGLDRSLGLVFGFIRGVVIVCLMYMVFNLFHSSTPLPSSFQQARLMPWVAQGAVYLKQLIPSDYLHDTSISLKTHTGEEGVPFEVIPNVEETVKNLSILKPISPSRNLDQLIEKYGKNK